MLPACRRSRSLWTTPRALRASHRGVVRYNSQTSLPSTVKLAYELHEPAKPVADARTSPILFLHGLFGSRKNYRGISKILARDLGRHIYALDLRNHGESPHHPRHDYNAMADDVAAFMDEHHIEQPTLMGHSMGAKTVMTLALRSPSRIKDIVSVDNAPVDAGLGSGFAKYIRGMRAVEEAGVTSQKEADAVFKPFEESIEIRQFLLGNLWTPPGTKTRKFRVPVDIISKALNHMGDFPYKDPEEARFERPALFVRGTKSRYVPDEVLPLIGQFFPLFECEDIDSGHFVISEKPEAFRQAVVRFLGPQQ